MSLTKSKLLLILSPLFVFLFVIIPLLVFLINKKPQDAQLPNEPTSPTITQFPSSTQKSFKILSTTPRNGEQNVSSGEIPILFTTDIPIIAASSFNMDITPPLPHYWKFENTYPATQIAASVLGGLQTNTTYVVNVKDSKGLLLKSWSFTTTTTPAESSSGLSHDLQDQEVKKYYPLFYFQPYTSNDFNLKYTDQLTLQVLIKNSDVEKVKQEVVAWIKSHDVDPGTHTINYINAF